MTKLMLVTVVALLASPAQAQPYDCGERTIGAMVDAVQRIAPMFVRRPPETTGAAPQQPTTREQWKQQLLAQGRAFCAAYPDDPVCGGQRR